MSGNDKAQDVGHFTMLKKSFKGFGKADPLVLASSVAFFTIFALPGVLVILVQVASTLFDTDEIRTALLSQARGLIGEGSASYLSDVLDDAKLKETATRDQIFGVAAILISATMAFVALQRGLNKIWGVKIEKGKGLKQNLVTRGISLLIMAGLSFLLPVTLLFDNVITFIVEQMDGFIPSDTVLTITGRVVSFLFMVFILAMLFKILPNAKVKWKDVWPGAILAAILFVFARTLVGLYIKSTGIGAAFGAGQAVLVMLVWVFMAAMILLFGAFHCHTVAMERGHGIDPGRQARDVEGAGDRPAS